MNSNPFHLVYNFFDFHFVDQILFQTPLDYFGRQHVFEKQIYAPFVFTRIVIPVLLILFPSTELENVLIELRPTNSWLKYVFYSLLFFIYLFYPFLWYQSRQLIQTKQPDQWNEFLRLCFFFGSKGTFNLNSVRKFAKLHNLTLKQSQHQLYYLISLFKLSALITVVYNFFVFGIEMMNFVLSIANTNYSSTKLTFQLLCVLHFKYVFNILTETFGVCLLLFLVGVRYSCVVSRQCYRMIDQLILVSKKSNIKNGYSNQLWSGSGHTKSKNCNCLQVFNECLCRLVKKVKFFQQLTNNFISLVYISVLCSALVYTFLFHFSHLVDIDTRILLLGSIFLTGPCLLPPCLAGQMLKNEVSCFFVWPSSLAKLF